MHHEYLSWRLDSPYHRERRLLHNNRGDDSRLLALSVSVVSTDDTSWRPHNLDSHVLAKPLAHMFRCAWSQPVASRGIWSSGETWSVGIAATQILCVYRSFRSDLLVDSRTSA